MTVIWEPRKHYYHSERRCQILIDYPSVLITALVYLVSVKSFITNHKIFFLVNATNKQQQQNKCLLFFYFYCLCADFSFSLGFYVSSDQINFYFALLHVSLLNVIWDSPHWWDLGISLFESVTHLHTLSKGKKSSTHD